MKKSIKKLIKVLIIKAVAPILVEFGNYLLSYERRDNVTMHNQHNVTDADLANYIVRS